MKRMLLGLVAFGVLGGGVGGGVLSGRSASAQNPSLRRPPEKEREASPAQQTSAQPTPAQQTPWSRIAPSEAMWMYEQQKRDYLDPTLAIRHRAEFTAWQRRQRLAAMQWYGYSNSRPSWHPTPSMSGTFSPSWTGNDYLDRYRWNTAPPPVVVRSASDLLPR
jgi:hypothetical protein